MQSCVALLQRALFYLEETANGWEDTPIQMCGTDVCFNGLTSTYERRILSFGEDDDGMCATGSLVKFKLLLRQIYTSSVIRSSLGVLITCLNSTGEVYMLTTSNPSSSSATGKVYKIIDPRRHVHTHTHQLLRVYQKETHGVWGRAST